MAHLNSRHVDYIISDLNYRGIVLEGFDEELIDHICSAVEAEMDKGARFIDAYHEVLRTFGSTSGLRKVQRQTLQAGNQTASIMIKNYFVIAWRNIRKHSFYSIINVMGLAIGIAACLIIVLYVADELQYDKYNSKADRIYRVDATVRFGGNDLKMTYRSAPEAAALMLEYPEIESTVRFRTSGHYLVRPDGETDNLKEKYVAWVDSTFFNIFSVNVIEGNPSNALAQPASLAISKKTADKYFPGKSPIGQSLILDNKYNAKVTAVYEDIPATSHFHFDILVSMVGDWPIAREALSDSYLSENFPTYLLLKKGTDAKALEKKLPAFLEKYMGPEIKMAFGDNFSMDKFRAAGNKYDLSLRPLTDIHLHSDMKGEFEPNSNIVYIYLFASVAALILIIACINFMNLSTARSGTRAKEVGIRKVMGSLRSHLIRQFLAESMLVTTFAFLIAVVFAWLLLPLFNNLALKSIRLPLDDPMFYLLLFVAAMAIGIVAGIYPSFFLSAFKPVSVLKGQMTSGKKSVTIRSALVVFQFMITVFLIIGAITVNRQLHFIQNKNIGFEKDQVIIIHDAYALRPNGVKPFKDEIVRLSAVESGTISGFVPVESDWTWRNNGALWKEGNDPTAENMVSFQRWSVDNDYLKTFRMKIIQGRDFSPDFPSDSSAVVLNRTAAIRLGLGDDPIGKRVKTFGDSGIPGKSPEVTSTVIGIVDDFHFSSMKENIQALGFFLRGSDGSVCFRFKPGNTAKLVSDIEAIWKKMAVGQPFQYSFLDEDFATMYYAEARLGNIFTVFSALAIIIACLGLFALTAFAAEQRMKEIGIRKVLGASVSSIVVLLSRDFGKLILIAVVVASPVAWFAVRWWLQSYTYKTEIGAAVYLLAGAMAFMVAFLTMAYQSIRAARTDPAKSLKNE